MPIYRSSKQSLLGGKKGAVTPAAFNPANYGTVAWWHDFSDNAQVFNNSDVAAANNQAVKTCLDKSGNNRTATRSTNGGTYRTNVQNGRNVVEFSGSAQWMTVGNSLSVARNQAGLTLAIVYRMMSNDTQGGLVMLEDNAFGDRFIAYYESTWAMGMNGVYNESASPDASLTWYIAVFRADYAGGNASIFINNVQRLNASVAAGNTPDNNSSSAPVIAVGSGSGAYDANVQIGELILYQGALSTGNRQALQTELASRWNITLS